MNKWEEKKHLSLIKDDASDNDIIVKMWQTKHKGGGVLWMHKHPIQKWRASPPIHLIKQINHTNHASGVVKSSG